MWNPITSICRKEYQYDGHRNVISEKYYSPKGDLTVHAGWAIIKRKYDEQSRVTEIRYFDEKEQPQGGQFQFPIEKYKYDIDFMKVSFYLDDSTLVTHINIFYEKGNIKKMTFTDKNDKLNMKLIQGINECPCAIVLYEYDEKELKTKMAFYDDKGELYDTEAGCAYREYKYNKRGQMTVLESFDKLGNLSNELPSNSAMVIRDYDIYGNLIEQSYYDKYGNLANTPWTWSRMLREWDDRGRLIKDVYIRPDGTMDEAPQHDDGTVSYYRNDNQELPYQDRYLVILSVESYGQMYEAGFRGVYVILEWNDWDAYGSLEEFQDAFMESRGKEKHLVLLPVGDKIGEKDIIEYTFSDKSLNARIMDSDDGTGENRRITLEKYEEWKYENR